MLNFVYNATLLLATYFSKSNPRRLYTRAQEQISACKIVDHNPFIKCLKIHLIINALKELQPGKPDFRNWKTHTLNHRLIQSLKIGYGKTRNSRKTVDQSRILSFKVDKTWIDCMGFFKRSQIQHNLYVENQNKSSSVSSALSDTWRRWF